MAETGRNGNYEETLSLGPDPHAAAPPLHRRGRGPSGETDDAVLLQLPDHDTVCPEEQAELRANLQQVEGNGELGGGGESDVSSIPDVTEAS